MHSECLHSSFNLFSLPGRFLVRSIEDRTGAKIDISRDPLPGRDNLRTSHGSGSAEHRGIPSPRNVQEDGVHRTPAQHLRGAYTDDAAASGQATNGMAGRVHVYQACHAFLEEVEQTPPPARSLTAEDAVGSGC